MNTSYTVRDVVFHGAGVFELILERDGLSFVAGDCVAIYDEAGVDSRPYSLASAPGEETLRFLIRRMDGGVVSPYLATRRPGDPVRLSPPFGWFRPGEAPSDAPFVFIATGTGIAPFLSHLRDPAARAPAQLLYGVRRAEDAVALDWLRGRCDLRLAVSREVVEGAHHGRVTDLLDAATQTPATHYYLCGLDVMIDEVTTRLEAAGTPITQIHRECFFNAEFETAEES